MRKKEIAALFGFGGLAAAVLFFRPRLIMPWVERTTCDDALFSVDTREKVVALTIDDGPHPEITPLILDLLSINDVKATFFLIGERVLGNEELVKRITDQGHEIGNHLMYDHPTIRLTEDEFERQLLATHEILSEFAPVHWFRPGSGWYTRRMLNMAKEYGYRSVIGSVYPYDAQISNVPFIVNYVVGNAFPGSIIALHDGTDDRWHTVEVLEKILPMIKARGYRFTTLSALSPG